MAGMLELERSRTRRERTFIGSECAVCEEPLEHTLRGERVLQFSCGHVSHEACFYEYIREFDSQYCPTCNAPLGLDTSRGGNVLDLGNDISVFSCFLVLTCKQRSSAVSYDQCPRTTMRKSEMPGVHRIHLYHGSLRVTELNGRGAKDRCTAIINEIAEISNRRLCGIEITKTCKENVLRNMEQADRGGSILGMEVGIPE